MDLIILNRRIIFALTLVEFWIRKELHLNLITLETSIAAKNYIGDGIS